MANWVTVAEAKRLLESAEFRHLVARRWGVSLLLTACLFVLYYGYILLVALSPALLARRVGVSMTLGIPIAAGVIVIAWLLTVAFVLWTGRSHDTDVTRLRERLQGGPPDARTVRVGVER